MSKRRLSKRTRVPQPERVAAATKAEEAGAGLNRLDELLDEGAHSVAVSSRFITEKLCGSFTHSSLMVSSSEVGSKGSTKEKSDVERSLRKRRCKTPGCMLAEGTVEEDREGMIARRLKKLNKFKCQPKRSSFESDEGRR